MKTVTKTYAKENGAVESKRTSAYIYYHLKNGTAVKTRISKRERQHE